MEETIELDLKEIFTALLRRIWVILLCAVMTGALALGFTTVFVTPQYQASVYMYVNNKSNTGTGNNAITSSELAVAQQLVATYINIIKRDAVLETAAERIAEDTGAVFTTEELRKMLTAGSVEETEIFQVQVTHPNPVMAAAIANAIAEVAPDVIANTIEGSFAKIIDTAKIPKEPHSPNYLQNAVLGAFGGLILAAAVVVLQVLLDKRIKGEDDLAKISKAPVLGTIPDFTAEHKGGYYRYEADSRKNHAQ